jgi:glycosyltransferase involved in cell wall biosynthesis
MNILWHSNAPWTATGYGVQTRIFTPRIRDLGHDVSISAFYGLEGASITWQGMTVYPKAFHPYGMDVVAQHAKDAGADVVITLVDAWVLDPQRITASGARWAPWFPVDHDPIPEPVQRSVKHAWHPMVYSRHAESLAIEAGMDPIYIPHGVDTNVYAPMPQDEARRKLGFPQDAFIVGIVAANKGVPSRKALPTQLEAFAQFQRKHNDAMLYIHTHLGTEMEGLDLPGIMRSLGIPEDRVKVCDQYRNIMGYGDGVMAGIYSAMDVLSSVTMGEGFGVPIIEAQACGTPVIVGGWTAMPELVGAGWTVTAHERVLTPMQAYQYLPTCDGVLEALEASYAHRGDASLRSQARAFAMRYDADEVTQNYWAPALERMANDLAADAGTEAPPVEVIA